MTLATSCPSGRQRILPPPRTSGRIVVELAPSRVGMFRFLLEAYENVAYFTVLDKQIARLAVIFSPHRETATRQALDEIGCSLPMRVLSVGDIVMDMRLSQSIVGELEAAAVARIIVEDGYLGMGAEVRRFEADIAAYLNVTPEQVIVVNSGTAALHLAVEAVCAPGDAVLVPSLTFVASFQAITAARCVPIACDVYPHSATIDLDDATRRLTDNTRAIMPVHYASNPWQLDKIYAFAARHSLRVIEDAAHAFGCLRDGKKIGSMGDMVCFSFDGIKNITSGEGGCIIAHDAKAARLCADARLLSVAGDTQQRYAGGRSWDFDVARQGWRFHISNIMAAIGRVQLARLDAEFAPARRMLAALYRERLSDVAGIALLHEDASSWIVPHIFPVRILLGRKNAVCEALAHEGIPTGVHYKPNHLLTYFANPDAAPLPVTECLYGELLTLPLHPGLSTDDVERVCRVLINLL